MQRNNTKVRPYLSLHFLILIFGFTGILGKYIDTPSTALVIYRTGLTFIALGIYMRYKGVSFSGRKNLVLLLPSFRWRDRSALGTFLCGDKNVQCFRDDGYAGHRRAFRFAVGTDILPQAPETARSVARSGGRWRHIRDIFRGGTCGLQKRHHNSFVCLVPLGMLFDNKQQMVGKAA